MMNLESQGFLDRVITSLPFSANNCHIPNLIDAEENVMGDES